MAPKAGNKGLTVKTKSLDQEVEKDKVKTDLTSENIIKKESLESLQKIVSNPQQKPEQETKPTDYNDV